MGASNGDLYYGSKCHPLNLTHEWTLHSLWRSRVNTIRMPRRTTTHGNIVRRQRSKAPADIESRGASASDWLLNPLGGTGPTASVVFKII